MNLIRMWKRMKERMKIAEDREEKEILKERKK